MIKTHEKILAAFSILPISEARAAWIARARAESGRHERATESLVAAGMEELSDWDGSPVLQDGREVVTYFGGRAFVLRMDIHKARIDEAISRELLKEVKTEVSEKPGESLTSVRCPSCNSVMAKSPVCPNCSKGKAGYKILCICTNCGHEVYL